MSVKAEKVLPWLGWQNVEMRPLDETDGSHKGPHHATFSPVLQSQSGDDGKAFLTLRGGSWGFEFECDQRQVSYAEHVVLASGLFSRSHFPVRSCMTCPMGIYSMQGEAVAPANQTLKFNPKQEPKKVFAMLEFNSTEERTLKCYTRLTYEYKANHP